MRSGEFQKRNNINIASSKIHLQALTLAYRSSAICPIRVRIDRLGSLVQKNSSPHQNAPPTHHTTTPTFPG